jgi:hypothetical protein
MRKGYRGSRGTKRHMANPKVDLPTMESLGAEIRRLLPGVVASVSKKKHP